MFSVVSAAIGTTQRLGKHICAAVNQHATIEETVFSVWASRRYNKENLRIKIWSSSGIGTWQNNDKNEEDLMCDLK
jgi:hypothetical protein